MTPSEVSNEEWICRFIPSDEWDEEKQQPTPRTFRASNRELSVFHRNKVEETGSLLRDLCVDGLSGAGEAYIQTKQSIELGQDISDGFSPKVYWRPDKVKKLWLKWQAAHAHIESQGGNGGFPASYRSLLAENVVCLRPPD